MPKVNTDAVMAKLRAWEASAKGKQRMQQTINKYAYQNKQTTEAGGKVLTMAKVRELAGILVSKVNAHAGGSGMPASVAQSVNSLSCGRVSRSAAGFSVELNFTGNLARPSLNPGRYGGIENIIALFNKGYPEDGSRAEAISHVSGYWHGQYVFARGSREGLHFLEAAVAEFNAEYGSRYDIVVQLDVKYQ